MTMQTLAANGELDKFIDRLETAISVLEMLRQEADLTRDKLTSETIDHLANTLHPHLNGYGLVGVGGGRGIAPPWFDALREEEEEG